MITSSDTLKTTRRHMMRRGVALLTAAVIAVGASGLGVVAAPSSSGPAVMSQQQNVDWMSSDTASYLGSIGMDVMVPSWVPDPFTGVPPDVYAGDGSYSLYWMAPGSPPTFLHITGVVGGALPAGSKADLNVELSINESVQGWPAIRDIGIPAGSTTPIYDQVWWIVDGVRYSVESNNLGTDSLTIANSMLYLEAPVWEVPTSPPAAEAPYVPPTSVPVPVTAEPVYESPSAPPTNEPAFVEEPTSVEGPEPAADTSTSSTADTSTSSTANTSTSSTSESTGQSTSVEVTDTSSTSSTGVGGTSEPWSPDRMDGNVPSDGTAGPRPPVIGGDGTGGIFDTSLPRIIDIRP